jgi:hypothetical protein
MMLLMLSFDDLISVVMMHDSSGDDVVTSFAKTLTGGIIY